MIASLSLGLSQTASAQNNGNGPPTVDVNIVSSDSPIQVEIPTPLDTTVVSMPDVTVGNTVDVNVVGGIKSSVEYRRMKSVCMAFIAMARESVTLACQRGRCFGLKR
jgi:hypothetical protein